MGRHGRLQSPLGEISLLHQEQGDFHMASFSYKQFASLSSALFDVRAAKRHYTERGLTDMHYITK